MHEIGSDVKRILASQMKIEVWQRAFKKHSEQIKDSKDSTSQWLHSYINSNPRPHPFFLSSFRGLSCSSIPDSWFFFPISSSTEHSGVSPGLRAKVISELLFWEGFWTSPADSLIEPCLVFLVSDPDLELLRSADRAANASSKPFNKWDPMSFPKFLTLCSETTKTESIILFLHGQAVDFQWLLENMPSNYSQHKNKITKKKTVSSYMPEVEACSQVTTWRFSNSIKDQRQVEV